MVVSENFLLEELEEIHKESERSLKEERIKYEFNLYKSFCSFNKKKMCSYSSLLDFQNYCEKIKFRLI